MTTSNNNTVHRIRRARILRLIHIPNCPPQKKKENQTILIPKYRAVKPARIIQIQNFMTPQYLQKSELHAKIQSILQKFTVHTVNQEKNQSEEFLTYGLRGCSSGNKYRCIK